MGCMDSFCMKEEPNKVYIPKKKFDRGENFLIETINFDVNDYPFFENNYYDDYIQNIKKVYSEIFFENNRQVCLLHKIFISRDILYDKTNIIQIDITYGDFPEQRLTNQRIDGCNLEVLRPFIEKYNDVFNINSANWYFENRATDIYVKSEIDPQNRINTLLMYYKKDINKLEFLSTDFIGYHFSKGERTIVKPNEVPKIFNKFKSGFMIDNKPEKFVYEEPKQYNYKSNKKNKSNKNKNYNNYNNYDNYNSNNYSRKNSDHSSDSQRSASMRNEYGGKIRRVDRNGDIRDEYGGKVGNFASNGDVRDEYGGKVANISSNGDVRDEYGGKIGNISSNGDVRDEYGGKIGRIDSNGDIRDEYGGKIGNAEGMDKDQAAYLYFFKKD